MSLNMGNSTLETATLSNINMYIEPEHLEIYLNSLFSFGKEWIVVRYSYLEISLKFHVERSGNLWPAYY